MSAKTLTIFLLVVAVIALLGFGLIDKNEEAIAVGDPVPEVELTELATGEEASVDDFRGKWALLNVWASWCPPCRDEAPELRAFQDAHPDDLVVVGLDYKDRSDKAREFVEEYELTYPQLRIADSGAFTEDYGITDAVPENFLIDPEGKIALIWRGPLNQELLREQVEPLIEGAG